MYLLPFLAYPPPAVPSAPHLATAALQLPACRLCHSVAFCPMACRTHTAACLPTSTAIPSYAYQLLCTMLPLRCYTGRHTTFTFLHARACWPAATRSPAAVPRRSPYLYNARAAASRTLPRLLPLLLLFQRGMPASSSSSCRACTSSLLSAAGAFLLYQQFCLYV